MKVTGWAVVCTILRPDNTWFTKTITELPDSVSGPMDDYLTEIIEDVNYVVVEKPLILTKDMEVKCKAEQKK